MCIGIRPIVLPSSGIGRLGDIPSAAGPNTKKSNNGPKESRKMLSEHSSAISLSRKRSLSETYSETNPDVSCNCICALQDGIGEASCNHDDRGSKRSNSAKQSRTHSVRFEENKTFISSPDSITEDDRKELWYGLDDCARLNESSNRTIRGFREKHLDSVRHILCVASQCSHSPPPMAYLDTVRLRLPDDVRGLEMGMLPLHVRQRRQRHVKRVVEEIQQLVLANKLQSVGGSRNSRVHGVERTKEEILASHASRSSQASRVFAQVLAREVAEDVAAFIAEE